LSEALEGRKKIQGCDFNPRELKIKKKKKKEHNHQKDNCRENKDPGLKLLSFSRA